MKILFMIFTILLSTSVVKCVYCPYYCQCIVSKHLRHVRCIGKGLISVDLNVPHTVQWLQLSNNLIFELEDNIFELLGLRHIVELNLDKNAIQSIGLNAFSGLLALRHVDLSDNRLHSIPAGVFQKIPSLIVVILHGNPLNYFRTTEPFLNSSSLQVLDISHCRIKYIPELALSSLYSLVKLNLSSNNIENIDYFSYKDLIYLEEIDISNNKLTCDYGSEEFFTWALVKSIKVFGSICKINTTTLPEIKTMEKMIMYDSVDAAPETEDLSLNFDLECFCPECNLEYNKSSEDLRLQTKNTNNNDYLSLFFILTFITGFVVGISVTISFLICYNLFRTRERHNICCASLDNNDVFPLFKDLYNN